MACPPELRFVRHVKLYFKWFSFVKIKVRKTFSDQVLYFRNAIKLQLNETMWIDGAGRKVFLRVNAIYDIIQYTNNRCESAFYGMGQNSVINNDTLGTSTAKTTTLQLLRSIQQFIHFAEEANSNDIPESYSMLADYYLNITNIENFKKMMHIYSKKESTLF